MQSRAKGGARRSPCSGTSSSSRQGPKLMAVTMRANPAATSTNPAMNRPAATGWPLLKAPRMMSSSLANTPNGGRPEMPTKPPKKATKVRGSTRAMLPVWATSLLPKPSTRLPAERKSEDLSSEWWTRWSMAPYRASPPMPTPKAITPMFSMDE